MQGSNRVSGKNTSFDVASLYSMTLGTFLTSQSSFLSVYSVGSIKWDKMCKIPVHTRHTIKINKFKSFGCYMPKTLPWMNYGEYKNTWNETAYDIKEHSDFEERLKHA